MTATVREGEDGGGGGGGEEGEGLIWRELSGPAASGACEPACGGGGGRTLERGEPRRQTPRKDGAPGEVLDVHQHGVLLHVQLVSQQQQPHQLLVQTCVSTVRRQPLAVLRPRRLLPVQLPLLTLNLSVEVVGDDLQLSQAHVPHVPAPQVPPHQALADVGQVGQLRVDRHQ